MAITTKLGLTKPTVRTRNWTADINFNWDMLDAVCLVASYTNEAGIYLEVGDVVVLDTGNDDSVALTTTDNDVTVIGVVLSSLIVQEEDGLFVVSGPVDYLKVTGTVNAGDHLCSSTSQGYARKAEWYENAFAIATSDESGGMVSAVIRQLGNMPKDSMVCKFDIGLFDVHLFAT